MEFIFPSPPEHCFIPQPQFIWLVGLIVVECLTLANYITRDDPWIGHFSQISPQMHTYIHPSIHKFIHTYIDTYIDTYTDTSIQAYIYIYIDVNKQTNICMTFHSLSKPYEINKYAWLPNKFDRYYTHPAYRFAHPLASALLPPHHQIHRHSNHLPP